MKTPRLRRALAATTALALLAGCGASETPSGTSGESASPTLTDATTVKEALADNIDIETGDVSYDDGDVVDVALDGSSATADSDAVRTQDGTVTISAPGTYRLHGSLTGQVDVDTAEKGAVRLVLDGATVTSENGPAVTVTDAESVVVVLAEGSQNRLTDAATYEDDSDDAPTGALYSTADLTIGGPGSLTVSGRSNNGIVGKDGLVLSGGTITVDAVDDGIIGKDYLVVSGANVSVDAVDDGLRSDNTQDAGTGFVLIEDGTVTVDSQDDAVKGVQVLVSGGTLDVAGSTEAVEGSVIVIDDGDLTLRAADDALNATSSVEDDASGQDGGAKERADETLRIVVNGGTIDVRASGDGIDSNGDATITGGTVAIHGPVDGPEGALDVNGTFRADGGELVAVGSSSMLNVPSTESSQGWLAATFDGTVDAGEQVVVRDATGTEVTTFTAVKPLVAIVLSSDRIESGTTYTLAAGDQTATVTAGEAPAGGQGPAAH